MAAAAVGRRCRRPGKHCGDPEGIEIGLSTDRVAITADFTGADLTIFGALDNADPLVSRQGRYDVIVVLEGPPRPVVVRRKDRILGMWINMESTTFVNVPVSYSVATTRPPQDITDPKNYRQLSLGADQLYLEPEEKATDPVTIDEFTDALRARKKATGLYSERVGGVQFLSQNLFRATLALAPNVPVGTHKARAFLFKSGVFVKETSAQLVDRQIGLRAVDLHASPTTTACSTASSPCCWPCSPAGSEASSSAGIEAATWISTTREPMHLTTPQRAPPRAHARSRRLHSLRSAGALALRDRARPPLAARHDHPADRTMAPSFCPSSAAFAGDWPCAGTTAKQHD